MHNQGLIHTDLKPENILFLKSFKEEVEESRKDSRKEQDIEILSSTEIRLIDMGNSTFQESYHSRIVGTRHYRAPEVLLNTGWSYPSDLWAIGCILMEVYTGKVLFSPKDDLEHLAMLDYALGPIPSRFGKKAQSVLLSKRCHSLTSGAGEKPLNTLIGMAA
jgi:serine/threonine protein kinase